MAKGKPKHERDRSPAPPSSPRDPNLPRPDGPRVSNKGAVGFLVVIFGLLAVAVAAQFLTG